MSDLTTIAKAAAAESAAKMRQAQERTREKNLDKIIEIWHDDYYGGSYHFKPETPDCPEREQFTWGKVARDGNRQGSLSGWRVVVEGIPLIIVKNGSGDDGTYVVLTCPHCGAERAESFFDLAGLGRLLQKGHGSMHHCYDVEARAVAYAIGSSARDAGVSANEIVDLALVNHGDLIMRLMS